jgi:hypothetical protein
MRTNPNKQIWSPAHEYDDTPTSARHAEFHHNGSLEMGDRPTVNFPKRLALEG